MFKFRKETSLNAGEEVEGASRCFFIRLEGVTLKCVNSTLSLFVDYPILSLWASNFPVRKDPIEQITHHLCYL